MTFSLPKSSIQSPRLFKNIRTAEFPTPVEAIMKTRAGESINWQNSAEEIAPGHEHGYLGSNQNLWVWLSYGWGWREASRAPWSERAGINHLSPELTRLWAVTTEMPLRGRLGCPLPLLAVVIGSVAVLRILKSCPTSTWACRTLTD